MTDKNQIENIYPTKPDYENLVFGTARPQKSGGTVGEKKNSSSDGAEVTVLAIVAAVILVVIAFCLIFVSKGMFVSHDGDFSLIFRGDAKNPFKTAASTVATEANNGFDIDISDPPGFSVTEVESHGVMSVAKIAEDVSPSVVAVVVDGVNGYSVVSGVVLTDNGLIVTSAEALRWVSGVTVVDHSGKRYSAALVGMNLYSDIAVIKVDAVGLDAAVFGNSNAVLVGDSVVAIGTPYDLSLMGTTTSGIVSAINRDIVRGDSVIALIQSDITVTDGFAGGPLINKYGQIVGIVTRMFGGDYSEFGFAVPMDTVREIIVDIVNTAASGDAAPVPSLGINAYFMDDRIADAYGMPEGLVIREVFENTPTHAAGIRPGDVITMMDGVRLTDLAIYRNIKNTHSVGDRVELTVYRDANIYDHIGGEYLNFTVYFINEADIQQ